MVLLAGCATPNQFANSVVDANVAQELAHNRLVLLNIVRAYKRMPMHFSRMTAARVPVGVGNPTFALPTPFGPESLVLRYDWSTQLGIQQGVDSVPLDSQEFMRGITTPVSAGTMIYYLDQGWPQQMILHLFVRSIEVLERQPDGTDKLVQRYVNFPGNPERFGEFQKAIQGLLGCEIDPVAGAPTPYGPVYAADKLGSLEALAAARAADLRLSPVDASGQLVTSKAQTVAGYQLFRDTRFTSLRFTDSPFERADCKVPGEDTSSGKLVRPTGVINTDDRLRPAGTDGKPRTAVFYLRSPEAMLYYLGEIGRAQLDAGHANAPQIAYRSDRSATGVSPGTATLFRLLRGAEADAAVAVAHEGETFSLPRGSSNDRSMHVVSLLTQIFGLHNKGNDPPATLNVRNVP
jgi:hypothetical protein